MNKTLLVTQISICASLVAANCAHAQPLDAHISASLNGKSLWYSLALNQRNLIKNSTPTYSDSNIKVYEGDTPTLENGNTKISTILTCQKSGIDNTGVWINGAKKPDSLTVSFSSFPIVRDSGKTAPGGKYEYDRYRVSLNTPYEIESKNYKNAGTRQFYKFQHWFRIDRDISTHNPSSTLIEKRKKHEPKYVMNFGGKSQSAWLSSYTFTDYPGINRPTDQSTKISDCGYAQVDIEPNTKPEISDMVSGPRIDGDPNSQGDLPLVLWFTANATDTHTPTNNLIYTWTDKNGNSLKSGRIYDLKISPAFYRYAKGKYAKDVLLTVSDGNLTNTKKVTLRF
ncbi:hypothetical protein [Agaribacterium haliotis]|uniref:hypothetical protein n=1 Tax=Agaribacterium haliotis TaxID=2013869 RepID=UPI000BB579B9|nr:hypothetical protein [Agaribacterium haliotis]